jgi:hypothetical protein
VFAQERTLDKAMDYVDALSDPGVRGNSWSIGERCGHATPGSVQSLVGENKWDPAGMWDRIAAIAGRLAEEGNTSASRSEIRLSQCQATMSGRDSSKSA